ncbi:MAG: carboxypeptidase regulatory-like domain-containing protein [Rhodoferax sp.]|uniref:4Fe-4S dicluster domain-containing protein n=1 Tax=Rhodoferax sp. TaxID=50421 RepID=UPI002733DD79|nr:4Fe-4S dicluster domain-containing protein [Rhodoferax sp.]MDP2679090.1 carboxypeptidase regulatory-like domain-containing protein [Rhodoferax sp.]
MNKWNLIIDVAGCENCNNCVLAAKDELVGNDFPGYSAPHPTQGRGVIHIERTVRGAAPLVDAAYVPKMCNHCDDAPCVKASADGSVRKRDDGIVIIDPVRAKGRRDLVDACPYGSIIWNEQLQLPQSWFFDAHLLDTGVKAPRCVGVCPTQAMEAVKLSDDAMAQRAQAEGLRTLKPEMGTQPRVYYKNLHRADHCFIAGSVTAAINGRVECLEGAQVALQRAGVSVASTTTDVFGDFKFDALPQHSGSYVVRISHPEHGQTERPASIEAVSVVLDYLQLYGADA